MASTFSTRLRFELIGTGDQDGTWGDTSNTNLGTLLEESIAGVASVTHDDSANYTLSTANGATDEARQMVLEIGGALTAARNVVCPTQEKIYIVNNATSGGFDFTIKTSAGTGILVPNGKVTIVYCDGTNVVAALTALTSLELATALTVAQGGTGAATFTDGGILLGSGTGAITALAVLSDGEMIVGDGTTDPAIESGDTLRISIGVGSSDSPQFTGIELGAASDTTLTRASAGDVNVEGNIVYRAGGTDVPVTDGGMGGSSHTDGGILLGAGSSAITNTGVLAKGTILVGDGATAPVSLAVGSNDQVLTADSGEVSGIKWAAFGGISDTLSIATTSGTTRDLTGLTAGINEINLALDGVRQDDANTELLIQLGDSGGFETSGYSGQVADGVNGVVRSNAAGFLLTDNLRYDATDIYEGHVTLIHMGSNRWSCLVVGNPQEANAEWVGGGIKTLSGELTQIRLTSILATGVFNLGTMYLTSRI